MRILSDRHRVADLVEPGADGGLIDHRTVVDEAHRLGGDLDLHLPDPGQGGQLRLDGVLAVVTADVGGNQGQVCHEDVSLHAFISGHAAMAGSGRVAWAGTREEGAAKRRRRRALRTTLTELKAIASAAQIGGRMPSAASGTRTRL